MATCRTPGNYPHISTVDEAVCSTIGSGVQGVRNATIAVIGVGRVGSAIARLLVNAGYTVNAAGPDGDGTVESIVETTIPGAHARPTAEAVKDADIVIIAVPMRYLPSVDPAPMPGKILVDVMNYWPQTDGTIREIESSDRTSSELVAEYFKNSRLVKTLNHLSYRDMEDEAFSDPLRALAVISDDDEAARTVAELVRVIGFDPIVAGPLALGRAIQPDSFIFTNRLTRSTLTTALDVSRA